METQGTENYYVEAILELLGQYRLVYLSIGSDDPGFARLQQCVDPQYFLFGSTRGIEILIQNERRIIGDLLKGCDEVQCL